MPYRCRVVLSTIPQTKQTHLI